jgi:hypothetical protein
MVRVIAMLDLAAAHASSSVGFADTFSSAGGEGLATDEPFRQLANTSSP